jgi:hypothetical protein
MQPLKATPIPNSESSIGCCEVGARSRIDSRRWPRARLCCAYSPAASGPRCANGLSIAETRETSASALLLMRPQKPHIPKRCPICSRPPQKLARTNVCLVPAFPTNPLQPRTFLLKKEPTQRGTKHGSRTDVSGRICQAHRLGRAIAATDGREEGKHDPACRHGRASCRAMAMAAVSGFGSQAPFKNRVGSSGDEPLRISKCSCGVLTLPVWPERAMTWPRLTWSPRLTKSSLAWA